MTTIGITDLPGYSPESHKEFVEIVTNKWNLTGDYVKCAEIYMLRHWTAAQIYANMSSDGIKISGENFLPLFKKESVGIYNGQLILGDKATKKFWLSFRAIRYPLCGTLKHPGDSRLMSYVLIQVDRNS